MAKISAREKAIARGTPKDVYDAGKDARQYYREQEAALTTQAAILPKAVGMEEGLRPELQASYQRGLTSQAGTLLGVYESLRPITQGLMDRSIQQDMQTMSMAGRMGTQAYLESLPAYARNINQTMGRQAAYELSLGAQLSPEDMQFAQQSARAANAAMGMSGNRAVGMEVLSGYNLGRQRQMERRNYAMQAYGIGEASAQAGYQMYGAPALQSAAMYSIPGLITSAEASLGALGPQFLTPESQYLANIRANRIQQENADRAAAAQRSAGAAAGIGSAVAGIGTAVAGVFI